MKVAIPTENKLVCPHFGHCEAFTIVEIDPESKTIRDMKILNPPPHERGVIPTWLNQLGCDYIIAGGMGNRALALFEEFGIDVVSGTPSMGVEDAVNAFMNSRLKAGANPCNDPSFRHQGHGERQCHHD